MAGRLRLTAQGDFVSALPVALRAQEEARQFGTEDPRLVECLISTAVLSHYLGKPREAEQAIRQGISIVRGRPGREEVLSKLLDNLATFYYEYGGRDGEVEALRREALELAIRALGPEHARVGFLRSHLALSFIDRRKYDEAEAMLTQALKVVDERIYPVFAADIHMNLGSLARSQRQYPEAIRLFGKAGSLFEKFGGETSARMILPLLALGEALLNSGRAASAEAPLWRAIRIADSTLGRDNLRSAEIMMVQAKVLRAIGKRKEAREVERQARAIVALRSVDSQMTNNSRVHISDLLKQR